MRMPSLRITPIEPRVVSRHGDDSPQLQVFEAVV